MLELEKLSRNYFEVFLSRYSELNKKLSELKSEIEKTEIVKEIEELQEILRQDRIKAEEDELKVKKLIDESEAINIALLREDLEKLDELTKTINLMLSIGRVSFHAAFDDSNVDIPGFIVNLFTRPQRLPVGVIHFTAKPRCLSMLIESQTNDG